MALLSVLFGSIVCAIGFALAAFTLAPVVFPAAIGGGRGSWIADIFYLLILPSVVVVSYWVGFRLARTRVLHRERFWSQTGRVIVGLLATALIFVLVALFLDYFVFTRDGIS